MPSIVLLVYVLSFSLYLRVHPQIPPDRLWTMLVLSEAFGVPQVYTCCASLLHHQLCPITCHDLDITTGQLPFPAAVALPCQAVDGIIRNLVQHFHTYGPPAQRLIRKPDPAEYQTVISSAESEGISASRFNSSNGNNEDMNGQPLVASDRQSMTYLSPYHTSITTTGHEGEISTESPDTANGVHLMTAAHPSAAFPNVEILSSRSNDASTPLQDPTPMKRLSAIEETHSDQALHVTGGFSQEFMEASEQPPRATANASRQSLDIQYLRSALLDMDEGVGAGGAQGSSADVYRPEDNLCLVTTSESDEIVEEDGECPRPLIHLSAAPSPLATRWTNDFNSADLPGSVDVNDRSAEDALRSALHDLRITLQQRTMATWHQQQQRLFTLRRFNSYNTVILFILTVVSPC